MTIIGLFRRYHRWNPVQPTYGAFWGFGLGLGCGVGWGPGFGPDAVGFVGAGCGVGLSIGFTFAGIGIGLPTDGVTSLPYDALACVTCEAVNLAKMAAPVVADAGNKGLKSISEIALRVQKNVLKSLKGVDTLHPLTLSYPIDVNLLPKNRHSLDMTSVEWEQKLRPQPK